MPRIEIQWTASFVTQVDIPDVTDIEQIRHEATQLEIPEDEYSKYVPDTFEVNEVLDEDGEVIKTD